jgi:transcriptional regulator with XRE-family HTH domain
MPHPVDLLVGKKIRHRRWALGMTQAELAEMVGVRFQQVQKYEIGTNRVSASRLWEISQALKVPISFFFIQSNHYVQKQNWESQNNNTFERV